VIPGGIAAEQQHHIGAVGHFAEGRRQGTGTQESPKAQKGEEGQIELRGSVSPNPRNGDN
jgi:hypothetical protein